VYLYGNRGIFDQVSSQHGPPRYQTVFWSSLYRHAHHRRPELSRAPLPQPLPPCLPARFSPGPKPEDEDKTHKQAVSEFTASRGLSRAPKETAVLDYEYYSDRLSDSGYCIPSPTRAPSIQSTNSLSLSLL